MGDKNNRKNLEFRTGGFLAVRKEQFPVKNGRICPLNDFSVYLGKVKIKIKEQSLFAFVAARQMRCKTVAAVLGNTIHLWNVSREDFMKRTSWVIHEVEHVRQFQQYGFLRFSVLYLLEYIRNGYYNNRFEVEARAVETVGGSLEGIEFV